MILQDPTASCFHKSDLVITPGKHQTQGHSFKLLFSPHSPSLLDPELSPVAWPQMTAPLATTCRWTQTDAWQAIKKVVRSTQVDLPHAHPPVPHMCLLCWVSSCACLLHAHMCALCAYPQGPPGALCARMFALTSHMDAHVPALRAQL
jgi:hypothetical protein